MTYRPLRRGVSLASGLLTDTFSRETEFPENDHGNFNCDGEFDVGETFSGVPFETGLDAVDELRPAVPEDATMAQFTLRRIPDHDAVSTVIPGSTSPGYIGDNVEAATLPAPTDDQRETVDEVYEEYVHHRW